MKAHLTILKRTYLLYLIFFTTIFVFSSCSDDDTDNVTPKVSRIEINASQNSVKRFLKLPLTAKAYYDSGEIANNIKIQWRSSNNSVATINENGEITGVKTGQVEITASYSNIKGVLTIDVVSNPITKVEIKNLQSVLIVSHFNELSANITLESGHEIEGDDLINWSLNNSALAKITNDKLLGMTQGNLIVSAEYEGKTDSKQIFVNAVEFTEIPNFLATPASGSVNEIPIVIVRSLPTNDGINIDVSKAPDHWNLGEISLSDMKNKIDKYDIYTKFALEEATKFRGYNNATASPFIGYKVIAYITLYEQLPNSYIAIHKDEITGDDMYMPNYTQLFNRLNIEHYVNDLGMKELWLWSGGVAPSSPSYDPAIHGTDSFLNLWESNMSSPLTGDISNSDRSNNDLPIYNDTYVVYAHNIRRTQGEAIHNRGHQYEAIFAHVNNLQDGNSNLFWKSFVGQDNSGNFITGRCGWTHMPPNTTQDYDYTNTAVVLSDIEDWKPDNSGEKKNTSVETWKNIPYQWPSEVPYTFDQKTETQFYIYWMQSYPGYQNTIPHGSKTMTNWWEFVVDWENALNTNLGLYSN